MGRYIVLVVLLIATGTVLAQGGPQQSTVDSIDAWYAYLLRWIMEPVVGAALIGFVSSVIITQRWKMTLPADMPHDLRRRKTQRCSFFVGFVVTLLFWPLGWTKELTEYGIRGVYLILVSGALVSIVVGAVTPFLYAVVMNRLYRWGWFKEEYWSGEARAEAKRQGEAEQPGD